MSHERTFTASQPTHYIDRSVLLIEAGSLWDSVKTLETQHGKQTIVQRRAFRRRKFLFCDHFSIVLD